MTATPLSLPRCGNSSQVRRLPFTPGALPRLVHRPVRFIGHPPSPPPRRGSLPCPSLPRPQHFGMNGPVKGEPSMRRRRGGARKATQQVQLFRFRWVRVAFRCTGEKDTRLG